MADDQALEATENLEQVSTTPEENGQTFSADYVQTLRKEAAKYRTELKAAQGKLGEFEQAKMSEAERLLAQVQQFQTAAEQAQTQLRQARAEAAVAKAAGKLGINPDLATKLADLEFDDAGNPVNVEQSLANLAKAFPQLVGTAAPTVSPSNPQRQRALTPADLKGKSPDWINEHWDEVKAILKQG